MPKSMVRGLGAAVRSNSQNFGSLPSGEARRQGALGHHDSYHDLADSDPTHWTREGAGQVSLFLLHFFLVVRSPDVACRKAR